VNDGPVIAATPTDRVLDLFHGVRLTPTQRRIAHSLVQHAASAAYLSAAEVAGLARVSQPSVTRFAMALGYDGYPALRRRLREITSASPGPPAAAAPAGNELQRAVRAEADNLHSLVEQLADRDRVFVD
jgi:DNA-binding MurR/RpiR family transcriptional regulator